MTFSTKERLIQAIETTPEPVIAFLLAILEFFRKPSNLPHLATLSTFISTPSQSQEAIGAEPIIRGATAKDLLKAAGIWTGDDFEECLDMVYQTRSQIEP